MDDRDFVVEQRGPTRVFTPEMDSEDDLMGVRGQEFSDRTYRLFNFRRESRSWANPLCSESTLDENEISKRAKRNKKHSVDAALEKMSVPRRNAIVDLLNKINQQDRRGLRWDIIAIDNDNPEHTKRKGEILAFSVILARLDRMNQQRSRSGSQDQRRSSFVMSPQSGYSVPTRRGSKSYHPRQSPVHENRNPRPNQSFRDSHTIFEDDPFGSAELFSYEGKPLDPLSSAPLTNGGLPAHIPADEPIGMKMQPDKDRDRKAKIIHDEDGVINLDEMMDNMKMNDKHDLLGGFDDRFDQRRDHKQVPKSKNEQKMPGFFDYDEPIVVGEDPDRARGRKRADVFAGEKTPKYGLSHSRERGKSKSKPRRPSIHIPKDQYGNVAAEVIPGNRRRNTVYWEGSATTASYHSDQSVLEGEVEDYSSSGSSVGNDWRGTYKPSDGRYPRATRNHRPGPPSPQQPRYTDLPEGYQHASRPRRERYPSDSAVTRYVHTPVSASSNRPPLISQYSAPRFTPQSAHPYTYESTLPYPHETAPPRRRESMNLAQAQMYMDNRTDDYREREFDRLQRENDMLRREVENSRAEVNRRASMRTGRSSKYNHEPRLDRRYVGGDVPVEERRYYN